MRTFMRALLVVPLLLGAGGGAVAQSGGYSATVAFPNLPNLSRPLDLQVAPGYERLLFVVEQPGRIRSFVNDESATAAPIFLDITDRVVLAPSWEEGLLGLAFDPDFYTNGYFYVYYNAAPATPDGEHRSILSRFTATHGQVPTTDPDTELILMDLEQLGPAHNGGQVSFGPDGFLYVSIGDGMWGADPFRAGQDPSNLFGTVIRVDVANPADGDSHSLHRYAIPPDNPFVGQLGFLPEIWAYGFRNPWRFSFDRPTGRLWLGDVGEGWIEEVNVVERGGNYGWSTMVGENCYHAPPEGGAPCHDPSLLLPIWSYTHAEGDKCVTGGFVYRGTALPDLVGKYVYGDFISGRIWALDVNWLSPRPPAEAVTNELVVETNLQITAFGVDAFGELYFLDYLGGIHRIAPVLDGEAGAASRDGIPLELAGPNPSRTSTELAFRTDRVAAARVVLYDLLGREVKELLDGTAPAGGRVAVSVPSADLGTGTYVARLYIEGEPQSATRLTVVR